MTAPAAGGSSPAPAGRRRRVALVIGAGSVKCAAALGLWRVLRREGIEPDLYVGCSGGSLFAAVMALDVPLEEAERMTTALWRREVTRRRAWRSMLAAVAPRLLRFPGHFGMVHGSPLLQALTGAFGDRRFEDATSRLFIVATDAANGQQVTLEQGSIRDAVRASVAIPYIWEPWKIGDRWLLDGCLSAPLPVDVAMREGADLILAMGFESPYPRRIRSGTRYAFHVNSIYTNNLLRANYAFHSLAHHAEIIPILPEFREHIGLYDTQKFGYVMEEGERAAEAQLPYLRQLLAQPT